MSVHKNYRLLKVHTSHSNADFNNRKELIRFLSPLKLGAESVTRKRVLSQAQRQRRAGVSVFLVTCLNIFSYIFCFCLFQKTTDPQSLSLYNVN